MSVVENFERGLSALDPDSDDFVLKIDELVQAVDAQHHVALIPAIFRYFEEHPLSEMGAPGTLVHLTEQFYPAYKHPLLRSLETKPSYNAILMTNRILNSDLSEVERNEYRCALVAVAENTSVSESLREEARHFSEHQRRRG